MTERTEAGPLAEEAARLVEAGLDWARRAAAAVDPSGERIATGAPECGVCPVCRTVSALRDPSPEVAERLTGVVTDLASLVAAGLRAFETHTGTHPGSGHTQAGHTQAGAAHAGHGHDGHGHDGHGHEDHGHEDHGHEDQTGHHADAPARRANGVEHIEIA